MKIDFFRHSLLSRGGDKMIVVHANHLASKGHQVRILAAVIDTVFEIDSRVAIERLPATSKLGTIVSALTTRFSSDLVVADIIAMVCFLAVRNRDKLICYAQDYDESYYSLRAQQLLIRFFYTIGLKLFRIPVIAVSHPLADLLYTRFNALVKVVENGVNSGVFYPEPDPQLLVEKHHRKVILALSRSDTRKGFDLACDVLMQVITKYSGSLEVWTVGQPNEGLFPGMTHRHMGYVGEERLRKIFSSVDVFLYPTRHEGFPLMVIEAFACRCPVVTTSAVPYAVHGENALVSPIDDVDSLTANLLTILNDELLCSNLIHNAGEFSASCTLAESKRKFHSDLLELVQKRGNLSE